MAAFDPRLIGALLTRFRSALLLEAVLLAVLGGVVFANQNGWFVDFWNYYAAGERLNAGHALYALSPGDRQVPTYPPYVPGPSLQTPFMSLLWQILAHLTPELVCAAWLVLNVASVLWVCRHIARRGPVWGALVIGMVSFCGGGMITVGNVNGLLLGGYLIAWRCRDLPIVAGLIGLMAALKVLPATLVAWIVQGRSVCQLAVLLAAAAATGLTCIGMTAIALGPNVFVEFGRAIADASPSTWSVSGLTGLPWLSPAAGIGLSLAAVASRDRAASFRLAVLASALGGTAVGPATIPLLAGIAIPDRETEGVG